MAVAARQKSMSFRGSRIAVLRRRQHGLLAQAPA